VPRAPVLLHHAVRRTRTQSSPLPSASESSENSGAPSSSSSSRPPGGIISFTNERAPTHLFSCAQEKAVRRALRQSGALDERSDAGRLLVLPFLAEVSNIHRRNRHGSVDLSAGAAANLNWTLTLTHHEPERCERCRVLGYMIISSTQGYISGKPFPQNPAVVRYAPVHAQERRL
jgi:hypothetical protein